MRVKTLDLLSALPTDLLSRATEALKSIGASPDQELSDDQLTLVFRELADVAGSAQVYELLRDSDILRERLRVKAFIVGDSGVGKTTFCVKLATGVFKEEYKITVGVDFYAMELIHCDKLVKLVLWDLAGQERFGLVRPTFYSGASGGFIAFALDQPETLSSVPGWLEEVRQNAGDVPCVLLGTKLDLASNNPEARNVVEELGLHSYVPISSKTGENLNAAIRTLISACVE